jgi:restriction system protein
VAIPDFQTMMRPILAFLAEGQTVSVAQIREHIAALLGVTEEDQKVLLPSGTQPTFSNRVAWALTHMAHALLVDRPARGSYAITGRGRQVLAGNPDRVDLGVLSAFEEYRAFRSAKRPRQDAGVVTVVTDEVSPREAIGSLIAESDAALAADLLTRIVAQPPVFLETLALQLLKAMGYGGKESLLEHTGKSGDAGLDGLVRQDALGLDLVGVQAKRYDLGSPVQRPALQAFVGALQGAQTNRGVYITTGRFTAGARQFAQSVAMQLVLIDGVELTQLMVRYNVAVQIRETFDLKQIDEESFDE